MTLWAAGEGRGKEGQSGEGRGGGGEEGKIEYVEQTGMGFNVAQCTHIVYMCIVHH